MPTISMFFGIIIRMYFAPKEHNPPHIHAYYQDYTATFDIENSELIQGNMPSKQIKLLVAWIEIHREELMANWKLCQNQEKPFKIEPLS
jgi:predicted FMN-binding regulatory protein PaiB